MSFARRVAYEGFAGITILVLVFLLMAVTCSAAHSQSRDADAQRARVELTSGRVLEGYLRQIQNSLFLVQTSDALYEVSGEEIAAVNDTPGLPRSLGISRRLVRHEVYEVILPNGKIDRWSRSQTENRSLKVLTTVSNGASERELKMYETMEVYDNYGNRLEYNITPRPDSGFYKVTIELKVPIAPGESVGLTRRYKDFMETGRQGDVFTYQFSGAFPSDRIYYGKVRLPRGAEIQNVDPAPVVQYEHDGCQVLTWRRYYPKDERYPLRIVYRLPPEYQDARAGQG
ncbi:hypothetical protein ACFL6M_04155 [Candidatus Eisenbacteria bacterium]|uniref:DUF3857 domain-containing protein n=1 Tax=Eiseniibacteriota bacterium TaxID=2212470 RepID=A0ABV6YKE0_UNCEI